MNASGRPNTCKSNGNMMIAILLMASGARVSNTYITYPILWDSLGKLGVTPHEVYWLHDWYKKLAIR